jgi:hypothetical protein
MMCPLPYAAPQSTSASRFGTSSELGQYTFNAQLLLADPKAALASPLSIEYAMAVASVSNR